MSPVRGNVVPTFLGITILLAITFQSATGQLFEDGHSRQVLVSPEPFESPEFDEILTSDQIAQEAEKVVPKLMGDGWQRFESYPIRVSEAQGAVLQMEGRSFLFVTGGYLIGTRHDVTNQTYTMELIDGKPDMAWVRRADMPMSLTHVAQVAVGSRLYTCGGYLGKHPGPSVNNCFVYNLEYNTWREFVALPTARAGGGIVFIRKLNGLFFAGGAQRLGGSRETVDHNNSYLLRLHDIESGWEAKADLENPRNHLSAMEVNERYFFVGGQHEADERTGNQKSLNQYLPMENRWVERADMPYGIGHLSASTPQWGGGFLVIGGVQNGREKSDDILFYDMVNNSWVEVGKYERSVQTPVCGVAESTIFCSTGAGGLGRWNESFMRRIEHVEA